MVESLLCLIGPDRDVPDFSTLSRRQKTLAVTIPHRGSQGPLRLLIDIEPASATGSGEPARRIKVAGEAEWNEADQKTIRVRAKAIDPGDQLTCEVVFPPNAQARRHQTPCLAQDPHRN